MFRIEVKGLSELQQLEKQLGQVVTPAKEVVDYGFVEANKIVPVAKDKFGGGTKKAITKVVYDKDTHCALVLKQPMLRPNIREYHLWMHSLGRYDISKYIKSGDPYFMFKTAIKMQDYIIEKINNNINNIKK